MKHLNVLVISASDPSGGAGLEADLKVLAAHGVFALTAITALTVQDSSGVRSVHPTELVLFRRILELLKDDQKITAVKIGALADQGHLQAVRDFLDQLEPLPPVVLDPVIRATSGAPMLDPQAAPALTDFLLPYVSLITPNLAEASLLTGIQVRDRSSMRRAAEALCLMGAEAALVKGGHLKAESADVLCCRGKFVEWPNDIIPHEFHGTGCALAAAIAAGLARGLDLEAAVAAGRDYLRRCLFAARPGSGRTYVLDFPPATEKTEAN